MNIETVIEHDQATLRITRETLPLLLSAREVQKIGISRSTYYRLTHRADIPIIMIGERRYIHRDLFFEWLEREAKTN